MRPCVVCAAQRLCDGGHVWATFSVDAASFSLPMRAFLLLAPLALAACAPVRPLAPLPDPAVPGTSSAAPAASALVGPTWRAVSLPSPTGPVAVPAGQTLHVTFGADGQVTGWADCNRMFGRYTLAAPATLAVGDLGQTRMACAPGSLGDAFLQALQQSRIYEVSGQTLTLRTTSGRVVMLTSAPAAPSRA